MATHRAAPPDAEAGLRLLQALLGTAPTATLDFANAYLPCLCAWLEGRFPGTSPDLCEAAAIETLATVLRRPHNYDPSRASVWGYLRLLARRDLLTLLKRESKHAHAPLDENLVELANATGKESRSAPPLQILCAREDELEREQLVESLQQSLTPAEQRVLELLLNNVRATEDYAHAVGLAHLSVEEQAREVKRVKDRIKKRIERWRNA